MCAIIDPSERQRTTPAWLAAIGDELPTPLPLKDILVDSLYYPASGTDGDPVACFAGRVHSFVYVDYGVSRANLEQTLLAAPFAGYHTLARRAVARGELAPLGWSPAISPTGAENAKLQIFLNGHGIDPSAAYCEWLVFERNANRSEEYGPHRFSMLFLLADGAASYQALYSRNRIAPAILAIIQPGTGFGLNYTDFTDPEALLHRVVFDATGIAPELLVTGHYNREAAPDTEACWPEYAELAASVVTRNHRLHLWKH